MWERDPTIAGTQWGKRGPCARPGESERGRYDRRYSNVARVWSRATELGSQGPNDKGERFRAFGLQVGCCVVRPVSTAIVVA